MDTLPRYLHNIHGFMYPCTHVLTMYMLAAYAHIKQANHLHTLITYTCKIRCINLYTKLYGNQNMKYKVIKEKRFTILVRSHMHQSNLEKGFFTSKFSLLILFYKFKS
jgi:hypothetical protein